jgi:F-type H+-transporting ATPase subunit b
MQELVHQLGELFLQAVPIALIVLVFYFVFRSLFFAPLLKVMAERDARTLGARKAAESAQAAAADRVKQYQEALKQARARVYGEQESSRKKLLDERASQLKDVRSKVGADVAAAKERVSVELAAARKEVEGTTAQLAAEIARRILEVPPQPNTPARGAR